MQEKLLFERMENSRLIQKHKKKNLKKAIDYASLYEASYSKTKAVYEALANSVTGLKRLSFFSETSRNGRKYVICRSCGQPKSVKGNKVVFYF